MTVADAVGCRPAGHTHRTPAGRLQVRWTDQAAHLAFAGRIGRSDTAVLSRCLHTQLDEQPRVLVVDLSAADPTTPELLDVLRCAQQRASSVGVGWHLIDCSTPQLSAALRRHQRRLELPHHHHHHHLRERLPRSAPAQHRAHRSVAPRRWPSQVRW